MSKGITPVVATVLLIAITFGAAGTLYTMTQENIRAVEGDVENTKIPLNIDSLTVEQCYKQGGYTHIIVRNDARSAINASKMNLLLNGSVEDQSKYEVNPKVVNPKNTFDLNMTEDFGVNTQIKLTNGESSIEYACFDF